MINLSNHPVSAWSSEQLAAAERAFDLVMDIPFPAISPAASDDELIELGADYLGRCKALLAGKQGPHAVHVMGEMTFTFVLVRLLQQEGVYCVASTSHRQVEHMASGEKKSLFTFVQFRAYPTV